MGNFSKKDMLKLLEPDSELIDARRTNADAIDQVNSAYYVQNLVNNSWEKSEDGSVPLFTSLGKSKKFMMSFRLVQQSTGKDIKYDVRDPDVIILPVKILARSLPTILQIKPIDPTKAYNVNMIPKDKYNVFTIKFMCMSPSNTDDIDMIVTCYINLNTERMCDMMHALSCYVSGILTEHLIFKVTTLSDKMLDSYYDAEKAKKLIEDHKEYRVKYTEEAQGYIGYIVRARNAIMKAWHESGEGE